MQQGIVNRISMLQILNSLIGDKIAKPVSTAKTAAMQTKTTSDTVQIAPANAMQRHIPYATVFLKSLHWKNNVIIIPMTRQSNAPLQFVFPRVEINCGYSYQIRLLYICKGSISQRFSTCNKQTRVLEIIKRLVSKWFHSKQIPRKNMERIPSAYSKKPVHL